MNADWVMKKRRRILDMSLVIDRIIQFICVYLWFISPVVFTPHNEHRAAFDFLEDVAPGMKDKNKRPSPPKTLSITRG
jgi:hypothetical protein